MRMAAELTVQQVDRINIDEGPKSAILINGEATGKFVAGAVLEGSVQWMNFLLLFMTDDIPYEEMLRIVLLDDRLNLVDSALIGSPYSTGSFSSLRLVEPNSVSFRFIGDTNWCIELLPKPTFRIPFISEPPGVWRPLGFSRHFIIQGNPRPQAD